MLNARWMVNGSPFTIDDCINIWVLSCTFFILYIPVATNYYCYMTRTRIFLYLPLWMNACSVLWTQRQRKKNRKLKKDSNDGTRQRKTKANKPLSRIWFYFLWTLKLNISISTILAFEYNMRYGALAVKYNPLCGCPFGIEIREKRKIKGITIQYSLAADCITCD